MNSSDSSVPEPAAHRGLCSIPGDGTATRSSWPRVFQLPGRGFQLNHRLKRCRRGRQEAEMREGVGSGFVFNSATDFGLEEITASSADSIPYLELTGLETAC